MPDPRKIDLSDIQGPIEAASDGSRAVLRTALGIGNVEDTSDADKPISTATQAALDAKAGDAAVSSALDGKADVFTGRTITGGETTLALTDNGKGIRFEGGGELTIPGDETFPDWFSVVLSGDEGLTVVPGGDLLIDGEATPVTIPAEPSVAVLGYRGDKWTLSAGAGGGEAPENVVVYGESVGDKTALAGRTAMFDSAGAVIGAATPPVPFMPATAAEIANGATGLVYLDGRAFVNAYEPISAGEFAAVLDCAGRFTHSGTISADIEITGATNALNGIAYTFIMWNGDDEAVDVTFANPPFQVSDNITDGIVTIDVGKAVRITLTRIVDGARSATFIDARQYISAATSAPAFSAPAITPATGAAGTVFTIGDPGLTGTPTPDITAEGGWTINGDVATASTSPTRTESTKGTLRALTVTATNGIGSPAVWTTSEIRASVGPIIPTHIGHASVISNASSFSGNLTLPLSGISDILPGDDILLARIWSTTSTLGEEFPADFTKRGTTIAGYTSTPASYPNNYRIYFGAGKATEGNIASGLSVKLGNASAAMAIVARGVHTWTVWNSAVVQSSVASGTHTIAFSRATPTEPSRLYQIVAGSRNENIRGIATSSGWSAVEETQEFTGSSAPQGINFCHREWSDTLTPTGSNVGTFSGSSHLTAVLVTAWGAPL